MNEPFTLDIITFNKWKQSIREYAIKYRREFEKRICGRKRKYSEAFN
tara:strand:+ start:2858 stop:2998 length:141 start_codon:yes stop_codon:yes gene_type:complete